MGYEYGRDGYSEELPERKNDTPADWRGFVRASLSFFNLSRKRAKKKVFLLPIPSSPPLTATMEFFWMVSGLLHTTPAYIKRQRDREEIRDTRDGQ